MPLIIDKFFDDFPESPSRPVVPTNRSSAERLATQFMQSTRGLISDNVRRKNVSGIANRTLPKVDLLKGLLGDTPASPAATDLFGPSIDAIANAPLVGSGTNFPTNLGGQLILNKNRLWPQGQAVPPGPSLALTLPPFELDLNPPYLLGPFGQLGPSSYGSQDQFTLSYSLGDLPFPMKSTTAWPMADQSPSDEDDGDRLFATRPEHPLKEWGVFVTGQGQGGLQYSGRGTIAPSYQTEWWMGVQYQPNWPFMPDWLTPVGQFGIGATSTGSQTLATIIGQVGVQGNLDKILDFLPQQSAGGFTLKDMPALVHKNEAILPLSKVPDVFSRTLEKTSQPQTGRRPGTLGPIHLTVNIHGAGDVDHFKQSVVPLLRSEFVSLFEELSSVLAGDI